MSKKRDLGIKKKVRVGANDNTLKVKRTKE